MLRSLSKKSHWVIHHRFIIHHNRPILRNRFKSPNISREIKGMQWQATKVYRRAISEDCDATPRER